MKKLLLITDNFPFGRNEGTFILPELPALTERFEVLLVSPNCCDEQTCPLSDGVRVIRVNMNRRIRKVTGRLRALTDRMFWREVGRIFRSGGSKTGRLERCISTYSAGISFARDLRSKLRAADWMPDIIYCYWHMTPAFGVLRCKGWFGSPCVAVRAHGRDLYKFRRPYGYQPFKQECDRMADGVFLVSGVCAEYYRDNFSVSDPPKFSVARLGFDCEGCALWEPSAVTELVSCSSVILLKRVGLIVEALSLIDDVSISWTHIGGGDMLDGVTALAKEKLGGKPNISFSFIGQVTNEKVRELYKNGNYKFFITASETEGLPVSVIEASAYGIPSIATSVGGIPEIVDERCGLPVAADVTAAELAQQIKRGALMDDGEYRAMRSAARERWQRDYVAEKNSAEFARRLSELCEKK